VLLGYPKARWPAATLLICGLLAGLSLLFAGLSWLHTACCLLRLRVADMIR
jgi:hypothetical protein